MSFSANLQHLRATRSMTQEQLAMLLGVSRQAVSKWESDAAYPEMDKLLRLCDIFECSLDELARGDLTHRPDEPALAVAPGPTSDICDYDRHMRARAAIVATGASCALLGVAGFCGTGGIAIYGIETQYIMWPYVFLLAGILPACALLIFAQSAHRSFTRRHPFVGDFYSEEDKARARKQHGMAWAAAVVITIVGAAVCWFQTIPLQHLYGGLASLNISLACAVWPVVYASMRASSVNVASYNRRMEERAAWQDHEARRLSLVARPSNAAAHQELPPCTDKTQGCRTPAQSESPEAGPLDSALVSYEADPHTLDAGGAPCERQAGAESLYYRIQERRKAATGVIMALSAIVALMMLFVLRSPNWMLAPIIGVLACVVAWIAMPFIRQWRR